MIAPDSFELDDIDGHSSPVNEDGPADQEDAVAEAAHSCPEQAISIVTEERNKETRRERQQQPPPTPTARRTGTTSTGTPRSTGSSSRRSPRRCTPSARWRGRTPTTGTGSRRAARKSSSWPAARVCPTTTTSTASAAATRASPSPRRSGPRSCAAASWRWTSPSTASTAGAQPVPVPRRGQAVAAVRRRDRPRGLDEKIESGRIDFVDDLANIVPAVLTLAMMGIELKKWPIYSEPAHAVGVHARSTRPTSPRVAEMNRQMGIDMINTMMRDPGEPAAGPDQRAAAAAHRRRARRPTWRSWATSG